jgi:hypothetical protein
MRKSTVASPANAAGHTTPNYGKRVDGTQKGLGYFGEIPMRDGSGMVATELGASSSVNGEELYYPLIHGDSTADELDHLTSGKKATPEMHNRAIEHALRRKKNGLSPFK